MIEMNFYFNFREDTGEIWKLTNELDESTPYIEVDMQTYREFAEETKKLEDYMIVPSGNEDLKYEIKFKHKDLLSFDVDKSVHQIQKVSTVDTNNAFIIEQNIKNGIWTVMLTPQLKELLTQTTYYKDKNHLVFVTQQDDPNILLDTLDIKMWKILYDDKIEMLEQNKEVAKRTDVSLYCGKIFENYLHVVKE
jgi:hypothetical protein